MSGRPVDHLRREELLDGAAAYALEQGFSELSWRPVAAALNVSTTTLVYRFGTKEQMLEAILGRLRERMAAATNHLASYNPGKMLLLTSWKTHDDVAWWAPASPVLLSCAIVGFGTYANTACMIAGKLHSTIRTSSHQGLHK